MDSLSDRALLEHVRAANDTLPAFGNANRPGMPRNYQHAGPAQWHAFNLGLGCMICMYNIQIITVGQIMPTQLGTKSGWAFWSCPVSSKLERACARKHQVA